MAHDGLWEQLLGFDGVETAKRAQCQYLAEPGRYVITLLNTEYVVDLVEKKILTEKKPAGFLEQLCVLAYLIGAVDIPVADKLVKPQALPTGEFFFRGLHSIPIEKLEKAFGQCPQNLYKAIDHLQARRCEFGDGSIELYILPRVSLTIVIWGADEEFAARASVLLDRTAGSQIALDALGTAINLAVKAVITAAKSNS